MAQNYGLNSRFGFNVSPKSIQSPAQKITEEFKSTVGGLFDTVGDYFAKNEKVFNGDVEREINMYSRQMMIVGMNLKASDTTVRRFDMTI